MTTFHTELRAYLFPGVSGVIAVASEASEAAAIIAEVTGKPCDHRVHRFESRRVATAESLRQDILEPFCEKLAEVENTCEEFNERGHTGADVVATEIAAIRRNAQA